MSSMFHSKESREYMRICQTNQAKIREISTPHLLLRGPTITGLLLKHPNHGRRNFKDTSPLMSSLLVIFVWGGEAIL